MKRKIRIADVLWEVIVKVWSLNKELKKSNMNASQTWC